MLQELQSLIPRFNAWVALQWPQAKTKAFNAVVALSAVAAIAAQSLGMINLSDFVSPKTALYITTAVTLINYWLRNITEQAKEAIA
jgi:hypothetical protein